MKKILILLFTLIVHLLNAEIAMNDSLPNIDYAKLSFGENKTLEIVTWNIQNFPKKGDISVDYTANIILSIDADIYCLQEIESDSAFVILVEKLNQEDKKNRWKGFRADTDEWKMNLAYIYKDNVTKKEKFYEIFYENNDENHYAFPRHPLIMEFKYKWRKIIIINNHLKAKGKEKDRKRRIAAINRLDKYIKANFDKNNVIVLGDMNDQIADEREKNVFLQVLDKPEEYKFADEKIAAYTTANWSYPYWKYRGHLDHIFISNELFDEFSHKTSDIQTITIDKFMDGGGDARYKYITDHRPVALKLKF
ncbi:MAG: endonuclease/exonuclease/phosphatase family protein [Candidatus Cloacimonetes bacterium]|nr:endonuclease/exonuclease/phosphatase family protein [Candidatus Cloacimonadota bacterium]